jgi:hypothetical protein
MQNLQSKTRFDRGHSLSNAEEILSTCVILAVHVPTSAGLTIRESTTHVAGVSEHVFVPQTDMINNSAKIGIILSDYSGLEQVLSCVID